MKFVSVIVASYNKEEFIGETINSLLEQTWQNWEVIVVDDCSRDSTVDMVKKFADPRIVLLLNQNNHGANYCRNQGIKRAKGEYLIFLDADDILQKTCIENRVHQMENTNADCCVFAMGTFYYRPGDSKSVWKPLSKHPLRDFFSHKLPWSIVQPIWKKSFIERIGGFDEGFMRLQDVELNTRALLQPDFKFVSFPDEIDCYYRIDESRKNYDTYTFIKRWVGSSVQYFNKFQNEAQVMNLITHLKGTIYKTYLQVLYYRKQKKLTAEEFLSLKADLFNETVYGKLTFRQKLGVKAMGIYNLLPFRIPGTNRLIETVFLT